MPQPDDLLQKVWINMARMTTDKAAAYLREKLSSPADDERFAMSPPTQRLMRTMYARKAESSELLTLVKAREVTDKSSNMPRISVLCAIIFALAAIGGLITEKYVLTGVFSAAVIAACLPLAKDAFGKKEPLCETYVDSEELDLFAAHAVSEIGIDMTEAYASFQTDALVNRSQNEEEAAEIYSSLYEMKADKPDDPDVSWAFAVASSLLKKAGLSEKEYTPEDAASYQIMPSAGMHMTRKPAIIRTNDGLLVKKGLRLGK